MVLGVSFKSLIHFEFIFMWSEKIVQFDSFACKCPIFPTLFIEETVLSPIYILG